MTARRPLLTAVAAGVLLCAGWLVPAANATTGHPEPSARPTGVAAHRADPQGAGQARGGGQRLADSGSVDTTPYVYGGLAFMTAGGALVTGAVRRSRTAGR
ncbi:hypothetical protein [Streptomyces sp. I05A-00742]|uniref:hypothetical protein n=1 Tax=Streptomyces sp. I05A-00742 TaxID=2732853 RepID=UPI00148768C9|nr:hypothetical protein [Streptomyces sp. I05A-00742]